MPVSVAPRNRSSLGGLLGLALLAAAFAYRWIGSGDHAEVGGDRPLVSSDAAAGLRRAVEGEAEGDARDAAEAAEAADVAAAGADAAAAVEGAEAAAPDETAATGETTFAAADGEGEALSAEERAEVDDLLARAATAASENRLIEPAEDNALHWYEQALALDPRNADARRGRREVIEDLFELAHAALDGGDARPAGELLEALGEDAAPGAARRALSERLAVQEQVSAHLQEAARRMAAGQRHEPEEGSALASYRAALALDPRNSAALQGLAEIEQVVLTQALAAASEDNFADADRLLAFAGTILPGTQGQLETRARVLELRRQRADSLIARAGTALDARNLDSADALLTRAEAMGAEPGTLEALRKRLADARLYDHLEPGATFADPFLDRGGNAPELVVIPIGHFEMGSSERERGRKPHEGPRHTVEVARAFALGRTEVTVAQFRRFVRAANYVTDAERLGSSSYYDEPNGRISNGRGVSWRNDYAGGEARDADPVVHVSWNDAAAYVAWLGERTGKTYRLPSEAEFEYALRAGSTTRYPWGDGNPTRVVGNLTGDGDRSPSRRSWTRAFVRYDDGHWGPAPVASFAANAFGLFDLEGNVSEWVEDCWHDSYLRAPADGTAWVNRGCGRRVIRGGSWGSAPDQVRAAYRQGSAPDVRASRIGFRVARDL